MVAINDSIATAGVLPVLQKIITEYYGMYVDEILAICKTIDSVRNGDESDICETDLIDDVMRLTDDRCEYQMHRTGDAHENPANQNPFIDLDEYNSDDEMINLWHVLETLGLSSWKLDGGFYKMCHKRSAHVDQWYYAIMNYVYSIDHVRKSQSHDRVFKITPELINAIYILIYALEQFSMSDEPPLLPIWDYTIDEFIWYKFIVPMTTPLKNVRYHWSDDEPREFIPKDAAESD